MFMLRVRGCPPTPGRALKAHAVLLGVPQSTMGAQTPYRSGMSLLTALSFGQSFFAVLGHQRACEPFLDLILSLNFRVRLCGL